MAARILVADDSVTIQKVVELTFSKEDFILIPARNGEEAIRKAKEIQPDLILLDLVMPDKSGYEVCTALRAEPMLRTVPIIMLTGTFEAFDKDQGLRAGATDFLTKPFESQVLIGKVKQLLFARTVDMGAPASPGPAAKTALSPPPKEAPRPAPAAAPPEPPGVPPAAVRPITPPPPAVPASPLSDRPAAPAPAPSLVGELPILELPALELEAMPGGPTAAGAEASLIPGGLSLEELLAPTPAAPPEPVAPAPPPGLMAESTSEMVPGPIPLEGLVPEDEPVFDLTADMQGPSLPLIEVGAGEPPELLVEDLLRPAGMAPGGARIQEEPELRPEPFSEEKPEAARAPEIPLASEPREETFTGWPEMLAPAAGPPDIGELVEAASVPLTGAEVPAAPAPFEPAGSPPGPPKATAAPVAAPPPVAPTAEAAPPADALTPEMGTLRQAVTERVAHELAKELSDRLIERIERIVWEVVPDLAEILINREIERIRAVAEGKELS